ncbi:hypothetical protein HF295_04495 [Hujiaoplasma nucleasis]|uniref:Uncharacterized protein n=1 Tax=Hujiaoplasma nucleasis TaxID=2725268 RepID=A0A7L6N6G0_9MOLU|nr:hypothetical protein [Hujiaoplasma nucleasis]QLY40159.1 hypothetical protein HF295_04495 [Hujiaoplasma nucleasis]
MDNFELAMMGVKIASKILQIKTPEVRYFNNELLDKKGINAIFQKEDYIIAFNENWIESVKNNMEIMITCFHESRHAFQYQMIKGNYKGTEIISNNTIELWKSDFNQYHTPSGDKTKDKEYLIQDIEIDAISFAHQMMQEHFGVKTIVPDEIKEKR